jgi:hypothetical protein
VALRQANAPPTLPFRWGIGRIVASAQAAGKQRKLRPLK